MLKRVLRIRRWFLLLSAVFCRTSLMTTDAFSPRQSFPRQVSANLALRRSHFMIPPDFHHVDHFLISSAVTEASHKAESLFSSIPFQELGKKLEEALDIGEALDDTVNKLPERTTSIVLDSIGRDLLVFLAASVIVTPLAKAINVTPILGYLLAGALLGPHGFDVFSNTKADVELGDFGILFLLFSEGLEVSRSRLKKLTKYLPLGLAQISLTTGILTAALLFGLPEVLGSVLPLDEPLIAVHRPVEAVILAIAGALSTSAFIFPVLKERGWEEEQSGEAATSILLLQDLAVAPLLVLLPYLVGEDPTDYVAIAFLTAKATIGFGLVLAVGSYVLRQLFALVAQTRNTETFVALSLLVSAGMGVIAKSLGLTDTAGAFAAGVLLANTNYRAQIQADILPFKGILLGIFFMGAGSNFDTELALEEYPTILTGALILILLKAVTLFSATKVPRWMERNRLPTPDGIRLSLLLSGGGEFAFVVLALAEKLKVVPLDLGGVLTAIVLITMGVTPLLGDIAAKVSEPFVIEANTDEAPDEIIMGTQVAKDAVVVCGYGEVGKSLLNVLEQERGAIWEELAGHLPLIVAFDNNPARAGSIEMPGSDTDQVVLYGDGSNPAVIRTGGIEEPSAIYVTYQDYGSVFSAVTRLHVAFPNTPIFTRAQTRNEAESLKAIGATEVVVEAEELPRTAATLLRNAYTSVPPADLSSKELRSAEAKAAGLSENEVGCLLELYKSMDQEGTGLVTRQEVIDGLEKSNYILATDDEVEELEVWLKESTAEMGEFVDSLEFCRLYGEAPESVKQYFGCLLPSDR